MLEGNDLLVLFKISADTTVVGGSQGQETNTSTETAKTGEKPPAGLFGGGILTTVLLYGGLFAVLYFVMIRPQKKREKSLKEAQEKLAVGDSVVTAGGMYGTITGIGTDCVIVEFGTNKGVRIPIRKTDVINTTPPNISAPKDEKIKEEKEDK